jgi:predicted regulator of Ras-like GTPase activity (Roadblock/LC7/MglB family)
VDAAQALTELMQLSSQIEEAAILDGEGAVVSAKPESAGAGLAGAAAELVAAARDIGAHDEVTRVEVELAEGAIFVLTEGQKTVVARTAPEPSAGLVVYDLRTCLRSLTEADEEPAPKPKRSRRTKDTGGSEDTAEASE